MSEVRVSLFGGVCVGTPGRMVPAPTTRLGVLLAALVLARGAVVSGAELRKLLWPSGQPASAANQLHRLVGQLRRLFEPTLSSREKGKYVIGSSLGYRLGPGRVRSDLEDCEAAAAEARRLVDRGLWEEAVRHYLPALDVLREPLLGDSTWERAGHPAFAAVARLRVIVATDALVCAGRGGRLDEVVAVAEQISASVPFEEGLQRALILALAQTGRHREAMSVYERVRDLLLEQLDVEPGNDLRSAYEELLRMGAARPCRENRPRLIPGAVRPSCLRRCVA